jgi:hypothetical protein
MKMPLRVLLRRPWCVRLLTWALAGYVANCCSCCNEPRSSTTSMRHLGYMSGAMELVSEQSEVVSLLRTNGIKFDVWGGRIWDFEVSASSFDLALGILQTNHLVRDHIFILHTNNTDTYDGLQNQR